MNGPRMLVGLRHASQLLVLLAFCLLPSALALGLDGIYGTLYSLEVWGMPFAETAAAAQTATAGYYPGTTLLLGAGLSLAIALLLGRVFCSWVCPYGLLSELVSSLGTTFHPRRWLPGKNSQHNRRFLARAAVLVFLLALFALFSLPALQFFSFPGELSRLPMYIRQGEIWAICIAASLPALILCIEFFSARRIWCAYVCPQSVLLGSAAWAWPKKLPGPQITWKPELCSCKGAYPCQAACGLELNPRHKKPPSRRDCPQCGDCVAAFTSHGTALAWTLKSATHKKVTISDKGTAK